MRLEATFVVWSPRGRAFAQQAADLNGCFVRVRPRMGGRPGFYEVDIYNPGIGDHIADHLTSLLYLGLPYASRDHARFEWRRS